MVQWQRRGHGLLAYASAVLSARRQVAGGGAPLAAATQSPGDTRHEVSLTRTVSALQGATRMQTRGWAPLISIVIADAIRPHIPCIFSLSGRGASTSQLEARLPVLVCWRRRSTFCRIPRGAPPMMTWCAACAPRSHTTLNKTEFQNKQMPCKVIPMLRCETAARSHIVSPHNY